MIHEYDYVQDGQLYKAGVDVPDMASIVCTAFSGTLRNYELLSTDVDKLPTYDNLMTGSSAYCIDTGEFYKYEATTKQWYKQ
jgi:hypothetical protein